MKIKLKNNKYINIEIKGEGFPIIFIHSYLWDLNMWSPQIKELSKFYKCISIDLWGHGKSDTLDDNITNYSIESLAKDIIEISEILNINKFMYIGLSVGAMIGSYLGIYYQDKISKLILMDGYSGKEPEITKEKYFNMLNIIQELQYIPDYLADIITPMFFSLKENKIQGNLFSTFKKSLLNIEKKNINTIVALGKGIFGRKNLLPQLNQIKVSTLFLVGENDIPRPISENKEMFDLIDNSELIIIPEAGHISNLENISFVNKKIYDFFSK